MAFWKLGSGVMDDFQVFMAEFILFLQVTSTVMQLRLCMPLV
jgi:hypothetical protein